MASITFNRYSILSYANKMVNIFIKCPLQILSCLTIVGPMSMWTMASRPLFSIAYYRKPPLSLKKISSLSFSFYLFNFNILKYEMCYKSIEYANLPITMRILWPMVHKLPKTFN